MERYLATGCFYRQTLFKSELDAGEREDLERQLIEMYRDGISTVWFEATFPEGAPHGFSDEYVNYVRALREAPGG